MAVAEVEQGQFELARFIPAQATLRGQDQEHSISWRETDCKLMMHS